MTYKHLFFFILILVLAVPTAYVAHQDPTPATVEHRSPPIALIYVAQQKPARTSETSGIEIRQPPADKLSGYEEDEAFTYEETPKETESLLNKIKYWIGEKINAFLSQPSTKSVLEIAFYIGFAVLVLMLLNQFMKGNIRSLFTGKNTAKPGAFSMKQTNGSRRNLDRLIREAVDKNQLGLAVRYLYQRSLMQLQNRGFISWKKNKTNRDYLYEIKENELRDLFREVSRYYEYAEYGNFAVSKADFRKVQDRFNKMETIINTKN